MALYDRDARLGVQDISTDKINIDDRPMVSFHAERPLAERMNALSTGLSAVEGALDELEAALSSVLAFQPPVSVKADATPAPEPSSELAGFFTYSTARVRELRERVAYIAERVDL